MFNNAKLIVAGVAAAAFCLAVSAQRGMAQPAEGQQKPAIAAPKASKMPDAKDVAAKEKQKMKVQAAAEKYKKDPTKTDIGAIEKKKAEQAAKQKQKEEEQIKNAQCEKKCKPNNKPAPCKKDLFGQCLSGQAPPPPKEYTDVMNASSKAICMKNCLGQ